MTNKKKALLLLCLTALTAMVFRLPRRSMGGTEALLAMLKTAGATVVAGEVQFYAVLEERFLEMDELADILLAVSDLIGLKDGHVQKSEGETFRVIDVLGKTAFGPKAHIVVQSNPGADAGLSAQTYLLIVCRDTSVEAVSTVIERLGVLLEPLVPNGQISYYLTGELPGKRTAAEMEKLAQKSLSAVRGRIVEGMQDEGILSFTAYTPLIERYLTVDGDRFNLNLAIRYDGYNNKTVVWAGFPLIHGSY